MQCSNIKKIEGKEYTRTPEEMWLLENFAPTSHSKYVTNEYKLLVKTVFLDALESANTQIELPVSILPNTAEMVTPGLTPGQGSIPEEPANQVGEFSFIVNVGEAI